MCNGENFFHANFIRNALSGEIAANRRMSATDQLRKLGSRNIFIFQKVLKRFAHTYFITGAVI